MIISDSTPIQFWINGEETFNESNPICGLTDACFCQPFNCSDEITIQITDIPNQGFVLLVISSQDDIVHTLQFEEISSGVYQASFIACEDNINGKVYLSISSGAVIIPPDDWVNTFASLPMTASSTQFNQSVVAGNNWGNDQPIQIPIPVGAFLNFDVTIAITGTWTGTLQVDFYIGRAGGGGVTSGIYQLSFTVNQSATVHPISIEKINPQSDDEVLAIIVSGVSTGTANIVITMPVGYVFYDSDEVLASSDCIDLRNNHQCSKLIEYTNADDFDGIVYDISPQPTFYLRVPAQLLEDESPQTAEDLELSNGVIVTVRQTIQEKSIFKLGYMPPYMHTKVQKVLMHDTVIIDGIQWKRRDPYEAPRLEDYPLKKGEVLLTKYNSVLKNTI